MPYYEYSCLNGHYTMQFFTVANHRGQLPCSCGETLIQQITAPLLVRAVPAVCYDSPIDGRPITSRQARQEDLKRNGCREYDPGMRVDADRRVQQDRAEFERSVDETVEAAIEKMPTTQRGQLYSELTSQGVGVEYVRSTKEV